MLVNGKPGNLISIRDRGLLYGDGVFRTFVALRGKPNDWPLHFRKLRHDCTALGIACPDEILLSSELSSLFAQHPGGVVKLIVTRGEGTRGYPPQSDVKATHLWDVLPLPNFPPEWTTDGIRARVCRLRLCHQPQLAGIKHLNRLENVLAASEDADVAEGLLLDTAGNVIEGTRTNLFLVSGGKLVTPDLSRCGVAGVQRDRVMDWAARNGVPLQVRNVGLDEMLCADELFLVNSVIGLWSIRELEQRRFESFPVSRKIRKSLFEQDV